MQNNRTIEEIPMKDIQMLTAKTLKILSVPLGHPY